MSAQPDKARSVRDYAANTCGSEDFHRHGLCRWFVSTDGVQHLAETCGAHWLVDAIASHVGTKRKLQAEPFQVWTLEAGNADGVVLRCTDGNTDDAIATQLIGYSDFPRELLPFRLFCERGDVGGSAGFVLMLPEER